MISDFLAAMIDEMGLPGSTLDKPGVSVAADASRNDNGVTVCYSIGAHHVIWAPEWAVEQCRAFELNPASSDDGLAQFGLFCERIAGEFLDTGVMRVFDPSTPSMVPDTPDERVVELVREKSEDHERIAMLTGASDPDDVEEADIELDELDPLIRCINKPGTTELASYASARPWELIARWWDIGVLTHPEHRRQGLAVPCVAEVARGVLAAGGDPMYRHSAANEASARVASKLGFVTATTLIGYRLKAENLS